MIQSRSALLSASLTALPNRRDTAAHQAAVAELAARWSSLADRAPHSFFLSWAWIGCWLAGLPADVKVHVLRAEADGHTVGLALLVRGAWRRVAGVPVAPAWHLHATGRPELDVLCIEHNGLLVDARYAGQAEPAMLAHWWQATHGARELCLPGQGHGWPEAWTAALRRGGRAAAREEVARPSFAVDLDALRKAGGEALTLCGSNLRTQIRRTFKAYAQSGPLSLEVAADADQALAFLDRLIVLHQARWEARAKPGAFASPFFVEFHRRLVREETARGRVQMLRLRAGEEEIAYLYSFVHQGRVYFYQSGLNYEAGGKHGRPGYVAHVMAIELNARLGHAVYDFMAGEARYKQDLANLNETMSDVTLRTPSLRFALERVARQGVRRIKARLRGA